MKTLNVSSVANAPQYGVLSRERLPVYSRCRPFIPYYPLSHTITKAHQQQPDSHADAKEFIQQRMQTGTIKSEEDCMVVIATVVASRVSVVLSIAVVLIGVGAEGLAIVLVPVVVLGGRLRLHAVVLDGVGHADPLALGLIL